MIDKLDQKSLIQTLEDMKAEHIVCLDVRELTSITDYMVICEGRSTRHIQAIADKVREAGHEANIKPIHSEGEQNSEWVLIDLGPYTVHIMTPSCREHYQLEKLWDKRLGQDFAS